MRGKGGRFVRLTTLPTSWATVLKSGSLSLLEPSGPVQVCNGIALSLSTSVRLAPSTVLIIFFCQFLRAIADAPYYVRMFTKVI
jgi:hypothetical protein